VRNRDAGSVIVLATVVLLAHGRAAEGRVPAPAAPVHAPEAGEVRKFWLDATQVFPRRQCVVRMIGDRPEGEARFFATNGALCMVEHYRDGELDGERVEYYPNGNRFEVAHYVAGVPDGVQTRWFPNGVTLDLNDWSRGVMHGRFIQYFSNGNLVLVCSVVDGAFQGTRWHYGVNGVLLGITQWSHGQEIDRKVLAEGSAEDMAGIQETSHWVSLQLKDLWPDE